MQLDQKSLFEFVGGEKKLFKFCEQFSEKNFKNWGKNPPPFVEILNEKIPEKLKKSAANLRKKFDHFFILGIGGSALGARVLRDGLNLKNLEIIDSIDPEFLVELSFKFFGRQKNPPKNFDQNFSEKLCGKKLSRAAFFVISKSGKTVETIAQFEFFRKLLRAKKKDWRKNFVFIGGENFQKFAAENKVEFFKIPKNLSGRFSVFSPVGLLPVASAGGKIGEIFAGARKAASKIFDRKNLNKNWPLFSAAAHFLSEKKTSVDFIFAKKLIAAGNFRRQLLAESVGKNSAAILPHVAVGTRDQHSDLQLFAASPADKIFTFWKVEKFATDPVLPEVSTADFLSRKKLGEILRANLAAVAQNLTEKKAAVQVLRIPEISGEILGELLFGFEAEIFFLAKMRGVDPFDQPEVERAKFLAREILREKKI